MRFPNGLIKESMFTKQLPDLLGQALFDTAELILSGDKSFTTCARIEAVKSLACQYYKSYSNKSYQPKQALLTAFASLALEENADVLFIVGGHSLLIVDGTVQDLPFSTSLPTAVLAVKFVT